MKISIVILCILFIQLAYPEKGQAQPEVKKVLRIGIELTNFSPNETGSFSRRQGFTAGFLTGVRLHHDSSSAYLLGVEFNYMSLQAYRTNLVKKYFSYNGLFLDRYDQSHSSRYIELGLSFEPCVSFYKDMTAGFYVGGSMGIGFDNIESHRLSHVLIDSTGGAGAGFEPETGDLITPISFNVGINYFYKKVMADLVYKLTINGFKSLPEGEGNYTNNVIFRIGVVIF